MSLIPEFELGLCNAWILTIWLLLPFVVLGLVRKSTKTEEPEPSTVSSKTERTALFAYHIMWFLIVIYSVFLPLKLGTTWLYAGLATYLLGMIMYMIVLVNFATTPLDREPVAKGLYRYSRHPMYVASFIAFIGVGIASASWLVLLLSALYMVLIVIAVPAEERFLVQQYGDAYRRYMDKTPRWIGIPKSRKSD